MATKEWNIEKILDKMVDDWQEVNIEVKAWKNTGTYVLSGGTVDEVQQLLED